MPKRALTTLAALIALLLPSKAISETATTTLLAAVPAVGASSKVGFGPGATSADYFVFQTTYPVGATVTLRATCDWSTFATQYTWTTSGAITVAPNIGGCLYDAYVSSYAPVHAFTGGGLDDVTFAGTYSGAAASSFTVEVTANTAEELATGLITCVAKAALIDGETVTVNVASGAGAVVYEFDVAADGVTGGRTAVDVSTDTTAIDVAATLATAINAVEFPFGSVPAGDHGDGTISLEATVIGVAGNIATVETVADAGFLAVGMSGGVDAVDTVRWRKGTGTWTTGVNLTGAAQALSDAVTFTAAAVGGHDIGDLWTATYGGVTVSVTASGSAVVRTQ